MPRDKGQKAISRSCCSPLEWGGKGRRREGLGRAHWQDCCGLERLLGKDGKELLKHSLLCRGCMHSPRESSAWEEKDSAPGRYSCYHTFRPSLQADSQATISLKTFFFQESFSMVWLLKDYQVSTLKTWTSLVSEALGDRKAWAASQVGSLEF